MRSFPRMPRHPWLHSPPQKKHLNTVESMRNYASQISLIDDGVGEVMAALERCTALVEAGWEASPTKLEVEQRFRAGGRDLTLTSRQRVRLVAQAKRLAGRSRAYVNSARILEGALVVDYQDTAVYNFDVRRWIKLLTPRE